MIYYLSDALAVEYMLLDMLKTYLLEDIRFDTQYSKYGKLNITKEHPFARMLSDMARNKVQDVFPSVSVALVNDGSMDNILNRGLEIAEITDTMLKELEAQKYSTNRQQAYVDIRKALQKGGGTKVFADQYQRIYQQMIVIEVWADNYTVKDMLYEAVKDMLDLKLGELEVVGVENLSMSGKKDGDYNFDFGNVLFGANINITYQLSNLVFKVNTDTKAVKGIVHSIDNIHGG